jgi:methionyl-tRNA formyltransferase
MHFKTSIRRKTSLRVLFAGTPSIAVPSLVALSEMELEGEGVVLAGVLTNPDRPRGHGQPEPSDISAAAMALDVTRKKKGLPPIVQIKPYKLDNRARAEVAARSPDLLVSFAYGHIFGPRFLALFPLGGINIHPSLLPRYRGASPIPAQILAGEKETGICIQLLAAEMDAGDIITKDVFTLSGRETTLSLCETVGERAALLLRELLRDFNRSDVNRSDECRGDDECRNSNFASIIAAAKPQEGEPVYCREIKKEDGLIDWNESAAKIDAQIRAYTPWPLSFTRRGNETLIILEAEPLEPAAIDDDGAPEAPPGTVLGVDKKRGILIQTGDGILAVSRLQWRTKKALDWRSFCNGERDFTGVRLG